MGMRRRIVDYDPTLGGGLVEARHLETTIAAFLIGLSILIMIYNLVTSAEIGVRAPANPWRSRSPEWQIPSPVPEHSFAAPLQVVGEPYDYGLEEEYVVMDESQAGHAQAH